MSNGTPTRQPIADDVTEDQINELIQEYEGQGATNCEVVTENGQRVLVCQWPQV